MPISVVQEKSISGASVASLTLTITGTTAGSILVVGTNYNGAGGTITGALTDGSSDTYTDSGKGIINGNVADSRMGAFFTCTAGTTTVIATYTGGLPVSAEVIAWEVAGLTSPSFDKVVEAGGTTGTTMSSGSTGTLSSAAEIGIGYLISNNGANANTQGAGWTPDEGANQGTTANSNFAEHIITASTAAITATATQVSGGFDAWCVTVQSAGDTLGGAMQRLMM